MICYFQTPSRRLHLESSRGLHESEEDRTQFDVLEHAAILKISGYGDWPFGQILEDPLCSFTFRLTWCHCDLDADLAASSPSHRHFEAACIRTLKTLVAQEFKYSIWTASELYTFERLVDSSLFQHCAFGSELFAQCRELFPLKGKIVSLDRALYTEGGFDSHSTVSQIFKKLDISRTGIERRRKKVLDWVKTCPQQYDSEAEELESRVVSFFDDLSFKGR
ncbi:hypothetical protein AAF712_007884, partial [Marasmius tenuissimus]